MAHVATLDERCRFYILWISDWRLSPIKHHLPRGWFKPQDSAPQLSGVGESCQTVTPACPICWSARSHGASQPDCTEHHGQGTNVFFTSAPSDGWAPNISTNQHGGLRRNYVCCLVRPPSPSSWPSQMRNARATMHSARPE